MTIFAFEKSYFSISEDKTWVSESSYFNRIYLHMQRLECLGYKLLAVHKNLAAPGGFTYKGDVQPCCHELVFGKKPAYSTSKLYICFFF